MRGGEAFQRRLWEHGRLLNQELPCWRSRAGETGHPWFCAHGESNPRASVWPGRTFAVLSTQVGWSFSHQVLNITYKSEIILDPENSENKQGLCGGGKRKNKQQYLSPFCLLSRLVGSDSFVTPWNCSPPGSSVHGISQAIILEGIAISFSKGSTLPRDWAHVSCIGRQILYHWATRETHRCVGIYVNMWIRKYVSICGHMFMHWCIHAGASQVALVVKSPPANAGDIRDAGSIPGSGRSPGGGQGNPF